MNLQIEYGKLWSIDSPNQVVDKLSCNFDCDRSVTEPYSVPSEED